MSLHIDNAEMEARMRQLAIKTGLGIAEAIDAAVREKLDRISAHASEDFRRQRIHAVMLFLDSLGDLPKIDQQQIEREMYDEFGVER